MTLKKRKYFKTDETEENTLEKEQEELAKEAQKLAVRSQVDRFNLELEAAKQSELVYDAGKLYTAAKDITRRAKLNMEQVESSMQEEIRKNPSKYNVTKDTDSVVKLAVKNTKEYKEAFHSWCSHQRVEDEYKNIVDTIKQRGYDIKILVELWLNNYYSEVATYGKKKKTYHTTKRVHLDEGE